MYYLPARRPPNFSLFFSLSIRVALRGAVRRAVVVTKSLSMSCVRFAWLTSYPSDLERKLVPTVFDVFKSKRAKVVVAQVRGQLSVFLFS